MTSLAGKTAVVSGASSGIGAATARALQADGVRIAAGARRTDRLAGFELSHELDVTDPASCERFVEWAVAELGGIDILINAAGLALGRAPFDESTEADEHAVLETNVNGLLRMTRLCLPHVRDGGHIVNLGSIAGRQAYESGASYITSKFAVRGFTYALREDLLGRPRTSSASTLTEPLRSPRRCLSTPAGSPSGASRRTPDGSSASMRGGPAPPMAARCWNGCPPARCRRAGRTPCRPGTPIRRAWPPGRPPARFSLPCIRSCRSCGAVRPTWRRVTAPRSMGRPRSCPRTGRPRCGRAARTGARSTSASVSTPWARS